MPSSCEHPRQVEMSPPHVPRTASVGIVACGALAREIRAVIAANRFAHVTVRYLPAKLHNSPAHIPAALDEVLGEMARECTTLFAAYGDCGTAGGIDRVLKKHGATRLAGAHCYEFFAGSDMFNALHDAEPGTFYLTDYLTRQFDTLVYKPLGLDQHPELRDAYFGNYTRLLYLAQSADAGLEAKARRAADRLGLRFEMINTGLATLEAALFRLNSPSPQLKEQV